MPIVAAFLTARRRATCHVPQGLRREEAQRQRGEEAQRGERGHHRQHVLPPPLEGLLDGERGKATREKPRGSLTWREGELNVARKPNVGNVATTVNVARKPNVGNARERKSHARERRSHARERRSHTLLGRKLNVARKLLFPP